MKNLITMITALAAVVVLATAAAVADIARHGEA